MRLLAFARTAAVSLALTAPAAAAPVASVEIVQTSFRITRADGAVVTGAALAGTVLTLGTGKSAFELRIDAVEPSADPEITHHRFSLRPVGGQWREACEPDAAGQRFGFPMQGTLGPDKGYRPEAPGFSITCVGGAQAKCVRFGYKPWRGEADLALYRSCMRMVRADYCGDGVGTTRNGTPIDLYDRVGIQKPEPNSSLRFEAAWGPNGAVCVRRTRLPDVITLEKLVETCPRLAGRVGDDCTDATPGALLFNKSN